LCRGREIAVSAVRRLAYTGRRPDAHGGIEGRPGEERITMSDNSRIDWLLGRMKDEKVEVFLGLSTSYHTMQDTNPVRVLTGFKNAGDAAVILERDGRMTLLVSPAWDAGRAKERAPNAKVIAADDLGPAVLAALGGKPRTVGVAGLQTLPQRVAGPIRAAIGDRLHPMDEALVFAGRSKTEAEIAVARKMSEVAERVFDRMIEFARPEMPEYQLAAELYRESKALGGEDNFLLLCSSQVNPSIRAASRRVMGEGDVILAEISPGAEGQFVQICRTAVLGPINAVQQKNYDLLWRSMERGMKAARPGRTVAEVATEMNEPIAAAGFGDYCRPPFMRVRGHGLGTVSHLPGDIGVSNPTVLEEGMLFVMHPNQFLPGSGYMLCGEPVVITAGGAEPLTRRHARLTSIPV
jgi:Xaa-Pro aminopeptidase